MLDFYRQLPRVQRWFIFAVVTGMVIATNLSYVVAAAKSVGTNFVYLWPIPFNVSDTSAYYSMLRQAADGQVLLANLFTSETSRATLFHPLWLVLGWVQGLFHLSSAAVFHGARIVLTVVFLLVVFWLCHRLLGTVRRRNIAIMLIAFSSGVGALFASPGLPLTSDAAVTLLYPLDLWVAEANTFLTAMHSPLFLLSQLLLVLALVQLVRETDAHARFNLAILVLLLVLIHPYEAPLLMGVPLVLLVVRSIWDHSFDREDRRVLLRSWVLIVGISIAVGIYYFSTFTADPGTAGWAQQNITPFPSFYSVCVGYGILIPFAVAGMVSLFRRPSVPARWLLMAWFVTQGVLMLIPVPMNRRFLNGFHVILALLAAVGIDELWLFARTNLQQRVTWLTRIAIAACIVLLLMLSVISNFFVVRRALNGVQSLPASKNYLDRSAFDTMQWVHGHTAPSSIILANARIGNLVPAIAGRRVYLGHWGQTIRYDDKLNRIEGWFFRTNGDDAAKSDFLRSRGISYILFSPQDRLHGSYAPSEKEYLRLIYDEGGAEVYEVVNDRSRLLPG